MYKAQYVYSKNNKCAECGVLITNKAVHCWKHGFIDRKHNGKHNSNWKGGRNIDQFGYIRIFIDSTDPFYSMAQKRGHSNSVGYV